MQGDESISYRYWAFISYSSKDKSWAHRLHRAIESFGIPKRLVGRETPAGEPAPRHVRPVFRDRVELPAAADLGGEITAALQASRYLIVVCSPHAARSKWVNREIETFQRLRDPKHVLAVIVDGKVNAGDDRECFPPALSRGTPVAADARPEGDGKRNVMLKLLAGMLGVGFDELKQRDTHRRVRRLQAGFAAALAVVVAVSALAVYAERRRSEAVDARQRAESIMEFLVTDLGDKLLPLGRLDIVEDVQAQVDAYYADLGIKPADPYAQQNEAAAHRRKGDLLYAQGDPAHAAQEYQAALEILDRLAASSPDDTQIQRSLATTHDNVGQALQEQGDMAGAMAEYQVSLDIRTRLASSDPNNAGLRRELATSHNLMGTALWRQGDLTGSLEEFRASLAIKESLAKAYPSNLDWQYAVALEHSNTGSVLDRLGETAAALEEYRAGLGIAERLVASDFANTSWQVVQAALHNNMGASLEVQGSLAAALKEYEQAAAIMERLVASDPSNAAWQQDLALYQANSEGAR